MCFETGSGSEAGGVVRKHGCVMKQGRCHEAGGVMKKGVVPRQGGVMKHGVLLRAGNVTLCFLTRTMPQNQILFQNTTPCLRITACWWQWRVAVKRAWGLVMNRGGIMLRGYSGNTGGMHRQNLNVMFDTRIRQPEKPKPSREIAIIEAPILPELLFFLVFLVFPMGF